MSDEARRVVVGRIGRPHGLRGELSVEPRTDEPDRRFTVGATLHTQDPKGGPAGHGRPTVLTVSGLRRHQDRLLVSFEQIPDRTAAEAARGLLLAVDVDPDERPDDPEEFYDHQLVGLEAVTSDGRTVGSVTSVAHGAGQDLLVIGADDGEVLVPFVRALVPEVDLEAGRLVVADRPGLLTPLEEG